MPQPKEEEKLVKNASAIFHIFSSSNTLIRHGYPFLQEITPSRFNSNVELSKFIGCDVNDIARIENDLKIDVKKYRDLVDNTELNKIPDIFSNLETIKASKNLNKSDIKIPTNSCTIPLEIPTYSSDLNCSVLLSVVIFKRRSVS
ncbi:hypothetical protein MXB_5420 [Myxobolus squamalis]|nr:hypothetical protein MXB_5420 [Myxobolus squamalis]